MFGSSHQTSAKAGLWNVDQSGQATIVNTDFLSSWFLSPGEQVQECGLKEVHMFPMLPNRFWQTPRSNQKPSHVCCKVSGKDVRAGSCFSTFRINCSKNESSGKQLKATQKIRSACASSAPVAWKEIGTHLSFSLVSPKRAESFSCYWRLIFSMTCKSGIFHAKRWLWPKLGCIACVWPHKLQPSVTSGTPEMSAQQYTVPWMKHSLSFSS